MDVPPKLSDYEEYTYRPDDCSTENDERCMVRLDIFDRCRLRRGRPALVEALWILAQALVVRSFIPGSYQRRLVLRLFGARVGKGVVIKPGVRVKFPWRLEIGDHTWIGEGVWIDNPAHVRIGHYCCLSQGAYVCIGNHDWSHPSFELVVKPIELCDCSWIAAKAVVAPGAVVEEGAVVSLDSMACGRLDAWWIYCSVPAVKVKRREVQR